MKDIFEDDQEEFIDLNTYDIRDLDDPYKKLYWLRKSIIKNLCEQKFSVRAAKRHADRHALGILESI